jgi:hypothetical protein
MLKKPKAEPTKATRLSKRGHLDLIAQGFCPYCGIDKRVKHGLTRLGRRKLCPKRPLPA